LFRSKDSHIQPNDDSLSIANMNPALQFLSLTTIYLSEFESLEMGFQKNVIASVNNWEIHKKGQD